MKICPRCQKTYPDDNLNFCLEDGTTLQQMSSAPQPPPTVQMSQPPVTTPTQAAGGQAAWNTPQQYGGQPPKKSSKTWVWILLILGAVVLLCGGVGALLVFIGYKSEQGSNVTYNYNTSTPNRNASTFGNKTTSNTTSTSNSSRTSVTTLDLDIFESKEFNLYGTTETSGDELIVSSKQKDSYYVVVAPEKYTTADADSLVTLHNTANTTSRFGYGLIFHSDPSPLQQDYAFVIDTARKKYRVVHHSPHNEDAVVNWTSSPAIVGGTGENTLEARDHSGKIDLYINGTMVTSIKNDYGFSGGVIGLYVGDGAKVAFKDLEIRR